MISELLRISVKAGLKNSLRDVLRASICSSILAVCCLSMIGCTTFQEDHFFSEEVQGAAYPNFLRVRVKGGAVFSSARYVAGYYDERALDLFFNEIKTNANNPGKIPKIFEANLMLPGTSTKLVPLQDPSQATDRKSGTFMMIFSTNATVVANAIGAFAESNAVADAVINLLNEEKVKAARQADANLSIDQRQATATVSDLDKVMARILAQAAANQSVDEEMLRLLNGLARGLGSTSTLANTEEAQAWFDARRVSLAGGNP